MKVVSDACIKVLHIGVPKNALNFFRREIWLGLGAFGTFRLNWRDKPLAGTIVFSVFTVAQIVGLVRALLGSGFGLFWVATTAIVVLLVASVWHRRRYVRGLVHALQLMALFYLFYLARGFSMCYLAIRQPFYANHRG